MWTVGIDPGREALGWAVVDPHGRPVCLGLSRVKEKHALPAALLHTEKVWQPIRHLPAPFRLVFEMPQVYDKDSKGDPKSLIDLAAIVGWMASHLSVLMNCEVREIRTPTPHEWKGGTPKAVHQYRFRSRLLPEDGAELDRMLAAAAPPYLQHNVVDALLLARWGVDLSD